MNVSEMTYVFGK